jgi:hypothetical protein
MKIFGEPWDAPICDDAEQVPTPLGELCGWCQEALEEGDRGVLIPYGTSAGYEMRPEHAECHLRSMVGSPSHLMGQCLCAGVAEGDSGMSLREEAKKSWEMWTARTHG